MSSHQEELIYTCHDDCQPQGCPSHKAIMYFQSVTDYLHLNYFHGDFGMTTTELEMFFNLLVKFCYRTEISSVVDKFIEKYNCLKDER